MSYKQFNSIIAFNEFLIDVLKEYDEEYKTFLRESEYNLHVKLVIYEDVNGRIRVVIVSADYDEIKDICVNDKIVCIINRDLQITNYRIKK